MAPTDVLLRKLSSIAELDDQAIAAVRRLPMRVQTLARGEEAASDGQRTSVSCLLLEGFMHRFKLVPDGGRQILAFHTPGDIPDLQSLQLKVMDHTLAATIRSRVAFIEHEDLMRAIYSTPLLGHLLWRDSLIDAAIFRTWIMLMGRQPALRHMAHLLCEIFMRLAAVGLTSDNRCTVPVTQEEMADALGLSTVHTNRTLQLLREDKLLDFEGGTLTILDWERLQAAAQFDPAYLHLRRRPDFDPKQPMSLR